VKMMKWYVKIVGILTGTLVLVFLIVKVIAPFVDQKEKIAELERDTKRIGKILDGIVTVSGETEKTVELNSNDIEWLKRYIE